MILQSSPPIHLIHCFGARSGGWEDNFALLKRWSCGVRDRVCPEHLFGLGLRLTRTEAVTLSKDKAARNGLLEFLNANKMYACMIDGFMYGPMHRNASKEDFYEPDWRTTERRDFTIELAQALCGILPSGTEGSISTLPGSLKIWITDDDDRILMVRNLAAVVAVLAKVAADRGLNIQLCLAPEPDCFLEGAADTIAFFQDFMLKEGVQQVVRLLKCSPQQAEAAMRRHLGVVFDTCHATMQYEDFTQSLRAYHAAGIRVSRVRLSSAIVCPWNVDNWESLLAFEDDRYLHQVRATTSSGQRFSWYDMPGAMRELPAVADVQEVRAHFHLPISDLKSGSLTSVSLFSPEFFHELRKGNVGQIEIDSEAFEGLAEPIQPESELKSIARECVWTLGHLGFGE